MNPNSLNFAALEYPVHKLIEKRWSPRSFSGKKISQEEMRSLFEAARWSASANNEQPWHYVYAYQDTPGFDKLWSCLLPGNQTWAKNSSVLMVAIARTKFEGTGKVNSWAMHDLGMANAQMLLQALSMNIYGHPMAGFDKSKLIEEIGLDEDLDAICMIAFGYLGDADQLEEPFRSREKARRTRKLQDGFSEIL